MSQGLAILGGALTALGLYAASAAFFPFLSREMRLNLNGGKAGWLGSLLVGVTFAAGWTPCVGPILGSVLLYAGTQETAARGVIFLISYSAGFDLPIALSGPGAEYFFRFHQSFRKHFRAAEPGTSALLLTIGALLTSNYLSALSSYLIFWTGYTGI